MDEQAASPVAFTLKFRVRKYLGANERVGLKSVLFDTTFRAGFECVVSDSIPLRRLSPNTAHVAVLGPAGRLSGRLPWYREARRVLRAL